MRKQRRFFRWLFADRSTGQIVVAQWPNPALWTFLVASAVGAFLPQGSFGSTMRTLAALSLAVWAADEIFRGVNPWRRLLGSAVLLWLCIRTLLALIHPS